jgi:hypothetical protein
LLQQERALASRSTHLVCGKLPNSLWSLLAASEPNAAAPLGRFQYANVVANRASRANLQLMLSRSHSAYTGAYEHPLWGRVEIGAEAQTLRVTHGVLRAVAEPFGKPDALWVELEPGEGKVLKFESAGPAPAALTLADRQFIRSSGRDR